MAGGNLSNAGAPAEGSDDIHKCDDAPPSLTLTTAGNSITLTASQGTQPLIGGYTANQAGTIIVTSGGQTICTIQIDQPSLYTGSCQYTPTSADSIALTATLTDSVLYQDIKTGTLTPDYGAVTPGGGG